MIIVSQDKKEIVNFDNISSIKLFHGEGDYELYCCVNAQRDNHILIGIYENEERAKEVLQEMVKKYGSYLQLEGGPALVQGQMDIQSNVFNIPKVYIMPEE